MVSRVVVTQYDREQLHRFVDTMSMPFTVEFTKGKKRSLNQNRLQMLLCREIAEQLGDRTPEDVRAECKLTHGVPILRCENESFRQEYDAVIKPWPMETKLRLMAEPFDFGVTRLMTTKQKTQYLDAIYRHYSQQGLLLTVPEER